MASSTLYRLMSLIVILGLVLPAIAVPASLIPRAVFTFAPELTPAHRQAIINGHNLAFSKIAGCSSLHAKEKSDLRYLYQTATINHGKIIQADPSWGIAYASIDVAERKIWVCSIIVPI